MQAARNAYRASLASFMSGIVLVRQSAFSSPTHSHLQSLTARSAASLPSPRRGAAMPSAWGGLHQLASFVARRPLAVCVGVTAISAGAWAARSEWSPHLQRHLASTRGTATHAARATPSAEDAMRPEGAAYDGPPLRLVAAAAMIPHPAKEAKGGEDAYFICEAGRCMGVADGVGGWAEVGVDPGLYSSELMATAKSAAAGAPASPTLPQDALEAAHAATTARGSSTACILCVHAGHLHASNLGDSGFLVVRAGELAFMSPQQQHEFNFPYQIGSPDSMSDKPSAAQRFSMRVHPGDVIVLATDGVFDNVFPDEAAALVALAQRSGEAPAQAAAGLAAFARGRAADPAHLSPFAYGAQQLGYRYFGGKMDDITCVVAYVAGDGPAEQQQPQQVEGQAPPPAQGQSKL